MYTIYLYFFKIWIFYKRYGIHTKLLSLSQYNRFTRISRYVTLDIKFPVNTNSDKVQTINASSSINIRHKPLIEYKCVLFNFIVPFSAFKRIVVQKLNAYLWLRQKLFILVLIIIIYHYSLSKYSLRHILYLAFSFKLHIMDWSIHRIYIIVLKLFLYETLY